MEIQVSGAGCFPSARNPRVLWVGIEPIPPQLRNLQELIDFGLSEKEYAREDRPFRPHLTIGRIKSSRNLQALRRKMQELNFDCETVSVRAVTVMRSDLRPAGAIYSPIKVFPLIGKPKQL
jgi:2'-5' RNA ligase